MKAQTRNTSTLVLTIVAVLAIVIGGWHSAIVIWDIPLYLVPPPLDVWDTVVRRHQLLARNAWHTLAAALTGLALSIVFASILAVVFTTSRAIQQGTFPFVIALRTAPVVAVAPLITLLIGRGFQTSVVVVVIVTFFPILVNLMRGLTSPEPTSLELLHVCGASRWQKLTLVRIPYAVPYLFAGLRVATTAAILGAMLAEWLTGVRGLGYLILDSADLREVELMWAAIVLSALMALIAFWGTALAEKRVTFWRN